MFVRFFKPHITTAQAKHLLTATNVIANIGYQAFMFGKENAAAQSNLTRKETTRMPLEVRKRR